MAIVLPNWLIIFSSSCFISSSRAMLFLTSCIVDIFNWIPCYNCHKGRRGGQSAIFLVDMKHVLYVLLFCFKYRNNPIKVHLRSWNGNYWIYYFLSVHVCILTASGFLRQTNIWLWFTEKEYSESNDNNSMPWWELMPVLVIWGEPSLRPPYELIVLFEKNIFLIVWNFSFILPGHLFVKETLIHWAVR